MKRTVSILPLFDNGSKYPCGGTLVDCETELLGLAKTR